MTDTAIRRAPALVTRFHVLELAVIASVTVLGLATIGADYHFALHRDAAGGADWTWPRNFGLLVLPSVAIAITAAFGALGFLVRPGRLEMARHVAEPALTVVLGILAACQLGLLMEGRGSDIDVIRVVAGLAAPVALLVGLVLAEAEPHTYAGLRLPWRIEPSRWRVTHKLCGWLFVAGALVLGALVWLEPAHGVLLLALAGVALIPVAVAAAFTVLAGPAR